ATSTQAFSGSSGLAVSGACSFSNAGSISVTTASKPVTCGSVSVNTGSASITLASSSTNNLGAIGGSGGSLAINPTGTVTSLTIAGMTTVAMTFGSGTISTLAL